MFKAYSSTLFYLCLLLTVVSALPVRATRHLIEAETYIASNDLQPDSIRAALGDGCSGQMMLLGLDFPGEWVEYALTIGEFGTWSVGLRARGDESRAYTFRFTFTGAQSGTSTVYDVYYVGQGYG
jgi:hypothetical protein